MATPNTQAIIVPPINKRTRIPQAAIDDVIKQIAEKFKPNKIILFGSYAYGKPKRESDVDLLVIMKTDLKEIQQGINILRNINYHFGLDLIVKTPNLCKNGLRLATHS